MPYRVLTLDLFQNYEETIAGVYRGPGPAVKKAKRIVEASLRALHRRGLTAKEIMEAWQRFGDSAVVVATDGSPPTDFSAFDFAQIQAAAIAGARAIPGGSHHLS
jgi:hypothetical protein